MLNDDDNDNCGFVNELIIINTNCTINQIND